MSFSDALGQVDQIVQWEQQLASGSPFAGTTSTGATGTTGIGTTSTGNTDASTGGAVTSSTGTGSSGSAVAATFADALAQAQSTEDSALLDPTTTSDASGLLSGGDSQLLAALSSLESSTAGATSSAGAASTAAATTFGSTADTATTVEDPRIQAMIQEANSLVGEPYVWGGGHSGWGAQGGYDCSGFVSAVLHAGGYLSSPQDTTTLPSASGIDSGPGQYVTIYDRDEPGQEGHVIIDIAGQFYESGGEQGSWGGGGGVEKIATPPDSYLSTFNLVLHPDGL